MKVLLATAGSRGDVEPFAALARRLGATGHDALLALPDNSGANVSDAATASLGVDFSRVIQDQGVSPIAAMRSLRTVVRPIMRGVIVGTARIAQEFRPDVIVAHPKILSAPLIAEALGIPYVLAEIVPAVTPTKEFAAAGTVTANLGPFNRLTYAASAGGRAMFSRELDAAAELLGVKRTRSDTAPAATLVPVSPAILRRPADWPASVQLTGPWVDPPSGAGVDQTVDDPELAAFLDQEDVVYAGFGSMAMGDAERRCRAIVDAARERGLRLLVATGLGGLAVPDDPRGNDVLVRSSVDHARVLPRVAAAIHHGGIGTVHAVVRAGAVSIVVPFIADQSFWGARVHRAGLGPAPIPARRLTASRVASALAQVGVYREGVRRAAESLRSEDGTGSAVRALESLA